MAEPAAYSPESARRPDWQQGWISFFSSYIKIFILTGFCADFGQFSIDPAK